MRKTIDAATAVQFAAEAKVDPRLFKKMLAGDPYYAPNLSRKRAKAVLIKHGWIKAE